MTRRWAVRVLQHERGKDGKVLPTGKVDLPRRKLSERERAAEWYRGLGWPEHRVQERLARDFPEDGHVRGNGRTRRR